MTVDGERIHHRRREHGIPLRRTELVRRLADDPQLASDEREQFLQVCQLLVAALHHDFQGRLESLKDLYAPFDPDATTVSIRPWAEEQRQRAEDGLFREFRDLMQRANYQRLARADLERAAQSASQWGLNLHLDFGVFEHLDVYVRGDVVALREHRSWRNRFRRQTVEVPLYQRLVVIFRLRPHPALPRDVNPDAVYLKVFKDIPQPDVDMLLPGARFRLTLLDRGKIILPTLSGIVLAVLKIIKGALWVAFAGMYGALAVLGLVGGTVGYGVKSFLGYLRTKEKYQLSLTRSLYFLNLDNNAGVLFRLLDEAVEQECTEALLAYALLRRAGAAGCTRSELDRAAEAFLHELLGFAVDFEVGDALNKLVRLRYVAKGEDGRWRAARGADALLR